MEVDMICLAMETDVMVWVAGVFFPQIAQRGVFPADYADGPQISQKTFGWVFSMN
jgi:hypothetical protein